MSQYDRIIHECYWHGFCDTKLYRYRVFDRTDLHIGILIRAPIRHLAEPVFANTKNWEVVMNFPLEEYDV